MLGAVQVAPNIGFSYMMAKANQQLVRAFPNKITEPVLLPSAQDEPAVERVITLLEGAIQQRPNNLLAYRTLIQALAAQADWQAALDASNQAVQRLNLAQPEVMGELAIPYFYQIGKKRNCDEVTKAEIDSLTWFIRGEEPLRTFADILLFQGQPLAAHGAYCVADQLFTSATSWNWEFRETVLAVMGRMPGIQQRLQLLKAKDPLFTIFEIGALPVTIPAARLRWMTVIPYYNVNFGTPLALPDAKEGIFWWNGQATAVIRVEHLGKYTISASLRNSVPAPAKMILGLDGRRLHPFELASADNSWRIVHMDVMLERGYHTIDVWFLNNGVIDNDDRDGAIQWLEIRSAVE